jgi:large subunit ribosomal protein L17
MAVIELVEELEVAATTAPRKTAARKAAQQDKVEALSREEEAPSSTAPSSTTADEADQDAEAPVNASGDKGAEGPGSQAEGDDKA